MAKLAVYNLIGKKVEDIEVLDSVFDLPKNDDLVHQAFVSIMANQRQVLAHTKTRGERAGSGIKPWRQKGTGRARVGSVRTPVWRKGGIIFGPTKDRNYKKRINKKMNTKAILTVLSGKLKDGEMTVVDKLELKEKKTKKMAEALNNLKIKGTVLIGLHKNEKEIALAVRNLGNIDCIMSEQLNVFDILNHKNLILSKESVKYIEEKYKK